MDQMGGMRDDCRQEQGRRGSKQPVFRIGFRLHSNTATRPLCSSCCQVSIQQGEYSVPKNSTNRLYCSVLQYFSEKHLSHSSVTEEPGILLQKEGQNNREKSFKHKSRLVLYSQPSACTDLIKGCFTKSFIPRC